MEELLTLVDENDKVIGSKKRGLIDHDDIYRVSCLWVTNSKEQILLARRVKTKKHDPDKWGPAVAGTVSSGESYEETIKREAAEELGLNDITMTKTKKVFSTSEWKHFTQYFIALLDYTIDKFVIQEDEVSELKWFDRDELIQLVKDRPEIFVKSMPIIIQNFIS